jgi:hypothetical protein
MPVEMGLMPEVAMDTDQVAAVKVEFLLIFILLHQVQAA